MMGACLIGMIALVFLKETAGCSLRGTGIPGQGVEPELVSANDHRGLGIS